ncbi:MAG TPA: hypothetical protein VG942_15450 [Hyphomonadaceae bacterium]|nr:hypothetical protein [Hyphomonadaceae bacterium]
MAKLASREIASDYVLVACATARGLGWDMYRLLVIAALVLSGCVSVPGEPGSDRGVEIGLVAVHRSAPPDKPQATIVERFGGWLTPQGAGVGYASSTTIAVDRECRVVFLIENQDQLQRSLALVKSTLDTSKGDICVTG